LGDIDSLSEALKAKNADLHKLRSVTMPDAMAEAQQSKFTLDSGPYEGFTFTSDDFVSGSFPKDPEKREVAVKYLEELDATEMIRDELAISFAKSQHNEGMSLAEDLRQKGYEVEYDSTVNAQTLMAFVRERLRNGQEIDHEKLGCFVGRLVKPKAPSKKVKKASPKSKK
jgi:hypothetical protein